MANFAPMHESVLYGLNKDEVSRSRSLFGRNELTQKKRKSFFMNLLGNFGDPMIKVLLIALAINVVFLFGHSNWFETMGIVAAVLIAVTVSTVSEYGSEKAFEKLKQQAQSINSMVRREGQTVILQVSELVTGDIVILGAGDRIPADGVLIEGHLDVDQSALNGESKEARKEASKEIRNQGARVFENVQATVKGIQKGGDTNSIVSINDNGGLNNNSREKTDFLDKRLLFCGTVVTAGQGIMRLTSVGDSTFYGKLAAEIQEQTPDSPLKHKLGKLAKKISFYGYIGAALVAFSYLFNVLLIRNRFDPALILSSLKDWRGLFSHVVAALTLAVTVIVMAVPEGLPMMITVVLSSNMRRMLKDNVLVRKLNGIETAGSMNILFTDKTGTLTYGKPEVINIVTGEGKVRGAEEFFSVGGISSSPGNGFYGGLDNGFGLTVAGTAPQKSGPAAVGGGEKGLAPILALSLALNNGAEMAGGRAEGGNATDRALLDYACKLPKTTGGWRKISSIPFSSANKYMSARIAMPGGGQMTLLKGAPEKILDKCTRCYAGDGSVRQLYGLGGLKRVIEDLSSQAVRIIAVAVSENEIKEGAPFENLILVALVGIRDRIRKEAKRGVAQVRQAGIQTVMITGDSKVTAIAIAKEAGILGGSGNDRKGYVGGDKGGTADSAKNDDGLILTSDEMAKMSDTELSARLKDLRVVARALPTDKSRLVRLAQSLGLVAGMTGDGVNDAPALKKADIGFAMGSGTEVAKEAGDVVILDDNILSISRAVSYGRTIFKSIRKFIIFQLSINFCAMAVSVIAPLINIDTPITVIQMLWINLVMDTLAGLAFGGERPRQKYMNEPPKKRDEPIINGYMWQQIIFTSVYTGLLSIWFLKSPAIQTLFAGRPKAYGMTAFFALFMFMAIFNSFCARTHQINLLDYLALNKQFIWIMGSVIAIQVLLIYFGGSVFRTEKLAPAHLAMVVALALSVIPLDLLRKVITRRRGKSGGT